MSGLMTTTSTPEAELQTLRAAADNARANAPKSIQLAGLTIHYVDAASLYTAYKDIFAQRIYYFTPESDTPVIIDGGAHLGLATLYWRKQFPGARITCYEPDEAARILLRRNLADNGAVDVRIVEAGLADREGEAAFHADGADGGRIDANASADASPVTSVRTVRLSDQINEPVDLLKLNIEGQEWSVLCDLEQSGKINRVHRIVLEYHGWPGTRQSLGDILNLLDRCGFRYIVHDFDRETNPTTKPPFRLRSHAPWFCLVYAEQRADAETNAARPARPTALNWGDLRRVTPVSRVFGYDRGTPVDRYYIERFLARHAADIRGRVLEIADATYTRRFGGERVRQSDVLHVDAGNGHSTIVGDLTTGAGIPESAFDCILLTQTLHVMDDYRAAVVNSARALTPGGVLLATLPGISPISRYDMDRWGDWWRFTSRSARRVFEDVFGEGNVWIEVHGNVMSATAFVQGCCAEELSPAELDHVDPDYELVIAARAIRRS